MGFSQATTTHHFILAPIGGIIQVTTPDATDSGQIDTIQTHLKHIAQVKETFPSLTLSMIKPFAVCRP
jgi:hypothetical protein